MKKVLLFIGCMLLFTSIANAQVPQGIPYQAVARNGQGQPLASTNVKVRFSILDSTATGAAVYVESHSTTTSALGLFTANVGMGTASTGTFSSINWGQNFKFLKVELDTTATGNSYIDLGTQQMMSVPYALYSGKSQIDNVQDGDTTFWKVNGNSIYYNGGTTQSYVGIGLDSPQSLLHLKGTNSNPAEITLESPGSPAYHHGALVFKATGLTNKRALGLFMLDTLGNNEWFFGRPYGSALGGSSDQFVIQRLNTNIHNDASSGLANGANSPTGALRLFTVTNNGNVGVGLVNPSHKLEVSGDAQILGSTTSKFSSGEAVILELPQSQPAVVFQDSASDKRADLRMTGSGDFRFSTGNISSGSIGQSIKMFIGNNGNVGIGTSVPTNTFEVVNSNGVYNLLNTGTSYFSKSTAPVMRINNSNNTLNSNLGSIELTRGNGSGGTAFLSTVSDGNNGVQAIGLAFNTANFAMLLSNGSFKLKPLTIAPSNPTKGEIYFDDNLNKLRVYDGTTWQNCW